MSATTMDLGLTALDPTGQSRVRVNRIPLEATVRDLVQSVAAKMGLIRQDASGRPLEYRLRLEREGRHLHDSELVSDALQADDQVVLQPKINAG